MSDPQVEALPGSQSPSNHQSNSARVIGDDSNATSAQNPIPGNPTLTMLQEAACDTTGGDAFSSEVGGNGNGATEPTMGQARLAPHLRISESSPMCRNPKVLLEASSAVLSSQGSPPSPPSPPSPAPPYISISKNNIPTLRITDETYPVAGRCAERGYAWRNGAAMGQGTGNAPGSTVALKSVRHLSFLCSLPNCHALVDYVSPLSTHYLLDTTLTHLTAGYLALSQLTSYYSHSPHGVLFTALYSLLTTFTRLTASYFLLSTHYLLLSLASRRTTYHSPLSTYYSRPPHGELLTTLYSLLTTLAQWDRTGSRSHMA